MLHAAILRSPVAHGPVAAVNAAVATAFVMASAVCGTTVTYFAAALTTAAALFTLS
jgi:hypothetical protein